VAVAPSAHASARLATAADPWAREPGATPDPELACAALAASGAPLRRALARLAGRLVAARAYEPLGFARLADYARERLGLSGRELHDLARADAALARLPEIDAAFVAGRLGWTKLRLLCRVATSGDESHWLESAAALSAAALAREVRAVDAACVERGGAALDEDDAQSDRVECVRVHAPRWLAARWGDVQRLARRVAGERLAAWQCAEWVAAEVLSALPLDAGPEGAAQSAARGRADECDGGGCAPLPEPSPRAADEAGDAIRAELAALVANLDRVDAPELDARLRRAVALDRTLLARLGPLVWQVAAERLYARLGFRNLDAWARERLGMCARNVRALVRLERVCLVAPALSAAWRGGALSWSQAQVLVELAVQERSTPWLQAWIDRARGVTVRRLEDDVELATATGELDPALLPALPPGLQIGARPVLPDAKVCVRVRGPADAIRLFRATLATVQRRIEQAEGRASSPAEALAAMLDHVEEVWGARRPTPREHAVFARDGWRCTVPGCSSYRNLHAHHLDFRSAGGGDELSNLTTLCAWHHLRGVHARLLRIRGSAPDGLRFELPLETFMAGDLRVDDPALSPRPARTRAPAGGAA
jgi:hypothetical protein